jgi:hypothetical protein
MEPRGTLENLFYRIRRNLGSLDVLSPGLLNCALCKKPVATTREAIMREESDGVTLCQSCFELMLQKAAQTPKYRKLA